MNFWFFAAVVVVCLALAEGSPSVFDAVICNLMDTCAAWQFSQ